MKEIDFILETKRTSRIVRYEARKLLLGGFTGRNREEVMKHLEELRKKGVKAEVPKIPIFFRAPPYLLTTRNVIEVPSKTTSGEAEYVLLVGERDIYISVGSDHTDRELERRDIRMSKWVCPKVVSEKIWLYDELKDHWDDIEIRSYVYKNGKEELYQTATLKSILSPEDLIKEVSNENAKVQKGLVIFSGTIATIRGIKYSEKFKVVLIDNVLNRKLEHKYRVVVLK